MWQQPPGFGGQMSCTQPGLLWQEVFPPISPALSSHDQAHQLQAVPCRGHWGRGVGLATGQNVHGLHPHLEPPAWPGFTCGSAVAQQVSGDDTEAHCTLVSSDGHWGSLPGVSEQHQVLLWHGQALDQALGQTAWGALGHGLMLGVVPCW